MDIEGKNDKTNSCFTWVAKGDNGSIMHWIPFDEKLCEEISRRVMTSQHFSTPFSREAAVAVTVYLN